MRLTLTAGPGGVSSSTWAQMLSTLSRWEKSCSSMATRERSDSAAQGSSILLGPPLVLVLPLLPSSSPVHGLRMHLGATAANMNDSLVSDKLHLIFSKQNVGKYKNISPCCSHGFEFQCILPTCKQIARKQKRILVRGKIQWKPSRREEGEDHVGHSHCQSSPLCVWCR